MNLKLNLITVLTFLSTFALAQEQKTLAKFVISDARLNKVDVTRNYLGNKSYFVFYKTSEDDDLRFGSVMSKADSQSFGKIFNVTSESNPETNDSYRNEALNFKWSYINTYDNKRGTADVRLVMIYKPAGIAFELRIIPENLDVLEYKGYMSGSLQSLE